jgi:hypothetical protein
MRFPNDKTAGSRHRAGLVFLAVVGLADTPASAWSRGRHEDAEVVARSELIVVARMEKGSIRMEPVRDELSGASAYVHHAALIVTEVLKGRLDERRIPIIIHYGLLPKGDGDAIRIGDMAMHSFLPLPVNDARMDNIWLLRKRSGYSGREPGNGDYGIVDPEDLQPIALKSYLLAYLSPDPEKAVRRAMEANPEVVERGQRFLDRREIERILRLDDARMRVEKLLPYFARGLGGGNYFLARNGIVACGAVAGPYLLPVYREPKTPFVKQDVIAMWGEIKYRDSVPELITLLETHDRFWATQDLEADWWNRDVERARDGRRRDAYGEDENAVRALGRIGDPRARLAIAATLRRWAPIEFPPRDLVETCHKALLALAEE